MNDLGEKANIWLPLKAFVVQKFFSRSWLPAWPRPSAWVNLVIHAVLVPLCSLKAPDFHCTFNISFVHPNGYWCSPRTCVVRVHHMFHTHTHTHTHTHIWPYWPRKQLMAMQACANNFIAMVASVHLCQSSMKPLVGLQRHI